jgi:carboxypeptidase C (cathepsin A)
MNDDGSLPAPPFALVDNEFSILNASDLVFIDPVATGFSRAAKDEKPDQFFGDAADLDSVGEFIRLWTTRHDRWLSPKFLCGESYGVFRAAGWRIFCAALRNVSERADPRLRRAGFRHHQRRQRATTCRIR